MGVNSDQSSAASPPEDEKATLPEQHPFFLGLVVWKTQQHDADDNGKVAHDPPLVLRGGDEEAGKKL